MVLCARERKNIKVKHYLLKHAVECVKEYQSGSSLPKTSATENYVCQIKAAAAIVKHQQISITSQCVIGCLMTIIYCINLKVNHFIMKKYPLNINLITISNFL